MGVQFPLRSGMLSHDSFPLRSNTGYSNRHNYYGDLVSPSRPFSPTPTMPKKTSPEAEMVGAPQQQHMSGRLTSSDLSGCYMDKCGDCQHIAAMGDNAICIDCFCYASRTAREDMQ